LNKILAKSKGEKFIVSALKTKFVFGIAVSSFCRLEVDERGDSAAS
jgi:hypothetical protein